MRFRVVSLSDPVAVSNWHAAELMSEHNYHWHYVIHDQLDSDFGGVIVSHHTLGDQRRYSLALCGNRGPADLRDGHTLNASCSAYIA